MAVLLVEGALNRAGGAGPVRLHVLERMNVKKILVERFLQLKKETYSFDYEPPLRLRAWTVIFGAYAGNNDLNDALT